MIFSPNEIESFIRKQEDFQKQALEIAKLLNGLDPSYYSMEDDVDKITIDSLIVGVYTSGYHRGHCEDYMEFPTIFLTKNLKEIELFVEVEKEKREEQKRISEKEQKEKDLQRELETYKKLHEKFGNYGC